MRVLFVRAEMTRLFFNRQLIHNHRTLSWWNIKRLYFEHYKLCVSLAFVPIFFFLLFDAIWSTYPHRVEKPDCVKVIDATVGAIGCLSAALAGMSVADRFSTSRSRVINGVLALLLGVLSFALPTTSRLLVAYTIPCSSPSGAKQNLALWGLQIGCGMQSFGNVIVLQREPAAFTLGRRGELFGSLNDPKVLKYTTIEDQCFLVYYVCGLPTPYY